MANKLHGAIMRSKHHNYYTALIAFVCLLTYTHLGWADNYTWVPRNAAEEEQRLLPVDPTICKVYEQNLRYFAQQNVPMSCERPIAPQFKDRIQAIEWENLDPARYPALFLAIAAKRNYLPPQQIEAAKKDPQAWIASVKDDFATGINVFRRAMIEPPLVGEVRRGKDGRSLPAAPFWIIQFGYNDMSPDNPDEFWRCKPKRGERLQYSMSSSLHLYLASEDLSELLEKFSADVTHPSSEGQHLRRIDGRLFIENIFGDDWISLSEIVTEPPLADAVCNFKFTKTPTRSK